MLTLFAVLLMAVPTAGQETVHLNLWTIWGDYRVPLMRKVLDEFTAAYPWIEVEHTVLTPSERYEKFLSAVVAGASPDVMMLGRQEIPALVEDGYLLPLTPYLARDGIDPRRVFFLLSGNPQSIEANTIVFLTRPGQA